MPVTTLTSSLAQVDHLRAVIGAVKYRPPPGDQANILVVPDLTILGEGTVRALALLLEDPPTHFRVYRDELGLQPLAEADFLAELDRRRPR